MNYHDAFHQLGLKSLSKDKQIGFFYPVMCIFQYEIAHYIQKQNSLESRPVGAIVRNGLINVCGKKIIKKNPSVPIRFKYIDIVSGKIETILQDANNKKKGGNSGFITGNENQYFIGPEDIFTTQKYFELWNKGLTANSYPIKNTRLSTHLLTHK